MRILLLVLAGSVVAWGQAGYVWEPANVASWANNGSATFSGATGGAAIWTPAVSGASPKAYEVQSVLNVKSAGGTYIHFIHADVGARPGQGNYLSVEYTLPTYWQPESAVALSVNQCINGTVTQLYSTWVRLRDGITIRSIASSSTLWVYAGGVPVVQIFIPYMTGQPGYGGYNVPSGSGFAGTKVGHFDVVQPDSVTRVATTLLPNSVSLKWPGVNDDPVGTGLYEYLVFRNGTYLGAIPYPGYEDPTAQPSTAYNYNLMAQDYHGTNSNPGTSFTVTTPTAGAVDARRVGVLSTGTYWGGGGEQLDMLSGNLNFTIPLVTGQGRNGIAAPASLNYNSQNWRQDNGVNW